LIPKKRKEEGSAQKGKRMNRTGENEKKRRKKWANLWPAYTFILQYVNK